MSALRPAVLILAAVLAGCTFNKDGTVTRSDAPPPELMSGRLAPRPEAPAPTPPKNTAPAPEARTQAPVLASTTPGVAPAPAPAPAKVAAAPAAAPSAKPKPPTCCATLPQAAAISAAQPKETVVLSATTPHFDFGRGVAPFVVYALPPDARSVQIYSPQQRKGLLDGGDNQTRYADTSVLFLDADAKTLAVKQLDAGQRRWGGSAVAYYRNFEVPLSATRLVVSTDPQSEGRMGMSMIYGTAAMPLVATEYQDFKINGLTVDNYQMTTYGPVVVQVNR
jgi:hypothetical protein